MAQKEASLTALLAGERFDWIGTESAGFRAQTGMGGPDPDEEEAERNEKAAVDSATPKDASNSSILQQPEQPEQAERPEL